MINLTPEDKSYITNELSKFLKKNDSKGLITKVQSDNKKNILAFLLENNIPLLQRIETIPNAFLSGTEISSIIIPSNIKAIGRRAFDKCEKLVNVKIEEGVEEIRDDCFRECYSLSSIEIPNSVEKLGNNCFRNSGLKSILIPDSITYLTSTMFYGCSDDLKIYANSRKSMPTSKKLKCPSNDVEWLKNHLFVRGE